MPLAASPSPPPALSSSRRLYSLALAIRLANACLSRVFFQPDEYWQALEPAHRWVWGFGWTTWEWRVQAPAEGTASAGQAGWELLLQGGRGGIRSPLAVLPTAAAYSLLKAAALDSPFVLVRPPFSHSFGIHKVARADGELGDRLSHRDSCRRASPPRPTSPLLDSHGARLARPMSTRWCVRLSPSSRAGGDEADTPCRPAALRLALVLLQPAHRDSDAQQLDRDGPHGMGVGILAVGMDRAAAGRERREGGRVAS